MSARKTTVLFDDIAANMVRSFEGWDTEIPHQGEKGGVRERRVQDFLRDHLPGKYGVASGHVIDSLGKVSRQEDIVIFDRLDAPVLKADSYYQVFPSETVYATVEVKSILTSNEIEQCVEHARQLGHMKREGKHGDLGSIMSFVFAYDCHSSSREAAAVWIRDRVIEKTSAQAGDVPILWGMMCLKQKAIVYYDGPFGYKAVRLESGGLLYFFSLLLHCLSIARTASPSLFVHYGWGGNEMIEYDNDGKTTTIIGVAGAGKCSSRRSRL